MKNIIKKIIKDQNLNCSVRTFKENLNNVDWYNVSACQKLSEDFIREFKAEVCWNEVSAYQKLSEDFIREFKDEVDWYNVSSSQKLSEEFIREFKDSVDWYNVSSDQKLSEEFIREFKDSVDWDYVSSSQKLSEEFIREFKDSVDWYNVSSDQKLSEDFIREFKAEVNWDYVSTRQKLSEDFIREFKAGVNWDYVSRFQKLSEDFIREFRDKLSIPSCKNNWMYAAVEDKKSFLKENHPSLYETDEDYVYAYKSTRSDGYSAYNFQYLYEVGRIYESHCNHSLSNENSFGLSAWTEEGARSYHKGKLFKVRIRWEDLGAVVHNGGKLRASRIEILEEIN